MCPKILEMERKNRNWKREKVFIGHFPLCANKVANLAEEDLLCLPVTWFGPLKCYECEWRTRRNLSNPVLPRGSEADTLKELTLKCSCIAYRTGRHFHLAVSRLRKRLVYRSSFLSERVKKSILFVGRTFTTRGDGGELAGSACACKWGNRREADCRRLVVAPCAGAGGPRGQVLDVSTILSSWILYNGIREFEHNLIDSHSLPSSFRRCKLVWFGRKLRSFGQASETVLLWFFL